MGQRRALRRAGGSGRELDVDRIVELQRGVEGRERGALARRRGSRDLVETEHSGSLVRPQADDDFELRQAVGLELAGLGRVDLRGARPQRGEIVVVLVTGAQDQRPAARFPHRIFEFVRPVGGIDIDENEPGERRAELRQNPFADIGRPDADAIAFLQSKGAEPNREVLGAAQEIGVGPPHALVTGDERRPLRALGGHAAQELADRLADERRRRGAVDVGLREWRHRRSSRWPPDWAALTWAARFVFACGP